MTTEEKAKIKDMSKRFASAFQDTIGEINGSGWLIVDPLSGFLNAAGITNTLQEIPANEKHPQVLIMTFEDGTQFIPAGEDLKSAINGAHNWLWIDK